MSRKRVIIVGGGVSGLAAAGFLQDRFDCILVEREKELGGYCRTIYQDGFTWDYSGHFFHFRHDWIADYVHARMDTSRLLRIDRKSKIYFRGRYIDFPFQFNLHQLPMPDFIRCLADMYAAARSGQHSFSSFRDMVYGRYGRALSDFFLITYNEKLYSISADQLDAEAMGRFFPHIDFSELLARLALAAGGGANAKDTYNAQFSYHKDGARAYVQALTSYIPNEIIWTNAVCDAIDIMRKRVRVAGEELSYDKLVISAPLPSILRLTGRAARDGLLTANKVLVFNLGFDRPSLRSDHWVYYPEPEWVFFRVGHYDNILGGNRMSLYVEIALEQGVTPNVEGLLTRTLNDLERAGVIDGHALVSKTIIMLDPAYVHVTGEGQTFAAKSRAELIACDVVPIGRYGRWTYCSIEDNILEAYNLAGDWGCNLNIGPRRT